MGVFEAADSRDLQRFDISSPSSSNTSPSQTNQYIKFIRVDLSSFYGSEHFCPVSLIRAFGQSLAEEFDVIESQQNNIHPPVTENNNLAPQAENSTPGEVKLEGMVNVPSSTDTEVAKEVQEGSCTKEGSDACLPGPNSSFIVDTLKHLPKEEKKEDQSDPQTEKKDSSTSLIENTSDPVPVVEASTSSSSDTVSTGSVSTPSLSSGTTVTEASSSAEAVVTSTNEVIKSTLTSVPEASIFLTPTLVDQVTVTSSDAQTLLSSEVPFILSKDTESLNSATLVIEPSAPKDSETKQVDPSLPPILSILAGDQLLAPSSNETLSPNSSSGQPSLQSQPLVPVAANGNGQEGTAIPSQPSPPSASSPSAAVIAASSSKESIFIKLNNRIKILELNMSNNAGVMEDLKKKHESLENRMTLLLNQTQEKEQQDLQKMSELQEKLNDISEKVYLLVSEKEVFHWQLVGIHIFLMILEMSVIVIIMSSFLKKMSHVKREEERRVEPKTSLTPAKQSQLFVRSISSTGKRISPEKGLIVDHHPITGVALFGKKRKKKRKKNKQIPLNGAGVADENIPPASSSHHQTQPHSLNNHTSKNSTCVSSSQSVPYRFPNGKLSHLS